jgi:hypothetical protein
MKKILYLLSIAFIMLQSCSSDNNSENSNSSGNMLLKRLEYSDISVPIYFIYNGTKLNYFSYGETGLLKKQFTYSGDLITKAEWFENGVATGEKDTYFYSNNILSEHRKYSPGAVLERIYKYVYNSDGTIDLTSENSNGDIINFAKLYLDPNGNVINSESSSSVFVLFEYDNKNNPYRNITGYSEIFLTDPNLGNNNLTKKVFTNSSYYNYNYQYNSQNYPISCEILEPGQPPVTCNYYYY